MATPEQTSDTQVDPAFLAEREAFWHKFTGLTKAGIGVMVALLLGLFIFVY